MRKVYLTRDKSFVGCLGKLNVYVEDASNPETVISDIPCRKVCRIANGETVSFDIGEERISLVPLNSALRKTPANIGRWYKVLHIR